MSVAQIRSDSKVYQGRMLIAYGLILGALMLEMAALAIGSFLGLELADYWGSTKATRDAATADSNLLAQAGRASAVGAWLLPFMFIGIALFFAGIAVVLSAIIPRIKMRAAMLAEVYPAVLNRGPQRP